MSNDTLTRLPDPSQRKRLPAPAADKAPRAERGGRSKPPIDPRIEARRESVQGARNRRRFYWLVAVATVLVLVTGALGLARSPVLSAKKVNIISGPHVSARQVLFVSGLRTGQNLLSLDVDRAATRITVLPWVESARVTRHWPDQVDVVVTERQAAAQVAGTGDTWLVVDDTGRIIERNTQPRADLVRILGDPVPGGPGAGIPGGRQDAIDVAAQVPASMVPELASLTGSGNNLTFQLARGGQAKLCDSSHMADKLLAVNTMLANLAPATVGNLDVCVPSAPVLTPLSGGA